MELSILIHQHKHTDKTYKAKAICIAKVTVDYNNKDKVSINEICQISKSSRENQMNKKRHEETDSALVHIAVSLSVHSECSYHMTAYM